MSKDNKSWTESPWLRALAIVASVVTAIYGPPAVSRIADPPTPSVQSPVGGG